MSETPELPLRFRMNRSKRGKAVIINNNKFKHALPRKFSDHDFAKIYSALAGLGFEISAYTNKKGDEIEMAMAQEAKADHSDVDCFVCVALTYGDHGVIEAYDRPVQVDNFLEHFKGHKCPSLAGKPKIFIFQACNQMAYRLIEEEADTDSSGNTYKIPAEADFLQVWSLVPGDVPWRESRQGSCYIEHLCRVLGRHGTHMELTRALTIVNRLVSEELENNAPEQFKRCGKRLPCILNMLTKEVFFTDKSLTA